MDLLCYDAVCRPLSLKFKKGISCKIKVQKNQRGQSHTAGLYGLLQYELVLGLERLAQVIFYADDALPKTSISITASYFTTTDQTKQQY